MSTENIETVPMNSKRRNVHGKPEAMAGAGGFLADSAVSQFLLRW